MPDLTNELMIMLPVPTRAADGGPPTLARLYNPWSAVPDGLGGPGVLIAGGQ